MSIFSRKQKTSLEDFCRDFYDNQILNPTVNGVNFSSVLPDYMTEEIDPIFAHVDKQKLTEELMTLRIELFALAWTHKYVSGMIVINQSIFTKHYLNKNGKGNIWSNMEDYNNIIDKTTIEWITKLGEAGTKLGIASMIFERNQRKGFIANNIEIAQKNGINIDESVYRANKRIWSEAAWIKEFILVPLAFIFCERIGLYFNDIDPETGYSLTVLINGFYDGAKQSWDKVEIIN